MTRLIKLFNYFIHFLLHLFELFLITDYFSDRCPIDLLVHLLFPHDFDLFLIVHLLGFLFDPDSRLLDSLVDSLDFLTQLIILWLINIDIQHQLFISIFEFLHL